MTASRAECYHCRSAEDGRFNSQSDYSVPRREEELLYSYGTLSNWHVALKAFIKVTNWHQVVSSGKNYACTSCYC
jgi:hypothetical protein